VRCPQGFGLIPKAPQEQSAVVTLDVKVLVSKCIFRVHNVSQWPNLRHLVELLGGIVGLLEAVSIKKATESVCKVRTANARE